MREEEPWALFATTVVSHLPMLPTAYLFFRRKYVYEACISVFGITSSLMYHSCQSFRIKIFLDELGWHRLDNIAVIAAVGMWLVFICCFRDPVVERVTKYFTLLITIILQAKNPWDITYTYIPILIFACLPLYVCVISGRPPVVERRYLVIGTFFMLIAFPFFAAGLNDSQDPYRVFHSLWHLLGAISSYYLWLMVKVPGATGAYSKGGFISIRGDSLL
ncbi:NGX6/PGAP6/MYMK [Trypanosoma melophagium]|uniref:NGX6/PGAP6/MYMK n=1 Tax=Trypanosoma melophagium TaxID=715481 RepID=UPI00351A8197|nr:NGX6/PGAP6/MYMK [Trypanosoma melophagium]